MAASVHELLTVAAGLLCGFAVFLLIRGFYPKGWFQTARDRIRRARKLVGMTSPEDPEHKGGMQVAGVAFLQRLGDLNTPLVSEGWADKMRLRFTAMGRPELRPEDFIAQQQLYAVLFGVLGFLLMRLVRPDISSALLATIPFVIFGFFFPYIWLRDQISKRHKALRRALAFHIDLLTLSVEAGQDFGQALATVVERGQPGPLLDELSIMLSEMKLGKTREEGLRNLAARVQVGEITSFVSTVIQADRMGTSIGKVLRIQSSQIRVARAQRAEKAANQAPVKMLLPLVLCFFPTIFMILFGPIVYRLVYGG